MADRAKSMIQQWHQDLRIRTLRYLKHMDAIPKALKPEAHRAVLVQPAHNALRLLKEALVEKQPHVMGVADPEMVDPLHGMPLRSRFSTSASLPFAPH